MVIVDPNDERAFLKSLYIGNTVQSKNFADQEKALRSGDYDRVNDLSREISVPAWLLSE